MKSVDSYFDFAIKKGASDIHLIAGEKPTMRIDGVLKEIVDTDLSDKEAEGLIYSLLDEGQKQKFEENLELDFSHQANGLRYRINLHKQSGRLGLSARVIPEKIPSPDDLHFESVLRDFTNLLDGLILVVGPTGCGKSTTIASMIEEINKSRKTHVITIEDPVEFVFEDKESLIEQREVGIDTKSFSSALKHVLRQDPNIIMVGEMRDPETIATVLTAAETGHLVFSTLHTSSAAEAVERIVDVFEGSKQKQVLIQLAAVLRGVIAQQLLPTVDGKRVAAREILVNTPAVSNLIRENNIAQIQSTIQTGGKDGMITMDNSIKALLKEGLIDKEIAEKRIGRVKKA